MVLLTAGQTTTLNFNWNVEYASIGDHVLLAKTLPVNKETNLTNNSKTTTSTVIENVPENTP